jgi:tetratricopeptide (TPR) repeat protein
MSVLQCPTCGRRFHEPRCPDHGGLHGTLDEALGVAPSFPGYEVRGVLGRGGFGTVYDAVGAAGRVAIKTANHGQVLAEARLQREAAALRAIGPPNVPELHAAGVLPDGTSYLVMELVTWPTLAALLSDRPPLALGEFFPIAEGLMRALDVAHGRGLIHRDLKPENIFVGDRGAVKILDFGLVKQLGAVAPGLTTPGAILGSTLYMSPEQAAGRDDLDARSDLYSLGVVLFEMLAGRPPFLGAAMDVMQAHLARRPPRLGRLCAIPAAVEALVHRCLAKAREDRPGNAAEAWAALRAAATEGAAEQPAIATTLTGRGIAALAPTNTKERRAVGLLYFRAGAGAPAVQTLMSSLGGSLARGDGAFAVVFDHHSSENPARQALLAARALLERRLTTTAIIDAAPVTVVARPDGTRRYVSPMFTRDDCYPAPGDPQGVLFTEKTAGILDQRERRPAGRGLYLVGEGSDERRAALTKIVGRDAELNAILEAARGAARGAPAIVTLAGEGGVGKSLLLEAASERLRRDVPGIEVLELCGGAAGHATNDLRQAMRLALALPDARPEDNGRALIAARLGFAMAEEVWPGVAVAMGWADAADADVKALAAAPGALRSAAARAVGVALRLRAAEGPVAVMVDDVGTTEVATLDALELATLEEGRAQLLVVVTARPSFFEGRPAWGERAPRHLLLDLGALTAAPAGELCRRLLEPATDVPTATIDGLVARTRGIPLLLVELARGLKREGLVRHQAKGDGWYLASDALAALPDLPLVEWLAGRELAALAPDLARHTRLLALLGGDFAVADVEGVVAELDRAGLGDEFPLDPAVAIGRLTECGLLVVRGDGRCEFRSAVVREAVERATPPPLAQAVHEAAYAHYHGRPDTASLLAFARHAGRCGRHRDGFDVSLELARRAEARHAYAEAESLFGRALEHAGHGEPSGSLFEVVHGRGLMRYRLARYEDALGDLRRARAMAVAADDGPAQIATALDEATVLDWVEEWVRSRELAEEAAALAARLPGGPGALLEARLAMALGRSACRFSNDVEAARLLLAAAAGAEPLGDAAYETLVVALLLAGYVLATLERLDESEAAFARVIPLAASRSDQLHLASALGNRMVLWTLRDEPDRALVDLQEVLRIAREIGNPRLEANSRTMLATAFHWLARDAEAEAEARRAIEVDDHRYGASARLESRVILARILAAKGQRDAAATVLAEIAARQEAARARGSHEGDLVPSEETQRAFAELVIKGGSAAEWRDLEARARQTLTGRDLDEIRRFAARAP